jgi:hypothetical protein
VGGVASLRRHQQLLLRRSVRVQLPQRPGAARDLEGRAARHPLRATTPTTCRIRPRT